MMLSFLLNNALSSPHIVIVKRPFPHGMDLRRVRCLSSESHSENIPSSATVPNRSVHGLTACTISGISKTRKLTEILKQDNSPILA